jgi:hypothetical protein
VPAFQQHAEFGLEESYGGERPVCKGRDDISLVGSRSRVTGVALEWHQLRCLILEAGRLMRGSASLKLDASRSPRCPLSLDFPFGSARKSCPKNRKVSAGLGLVQIPDPPGRRSVGVRKPSSSPPPFLRLRSGPCSFHYLEDVFQCSVVLWWQRYRNSSTA